MSILRTRGAEFGRTKLWFLSIILTCSYPPDLLKACPALLLAYQLDGFDKAGVTRDQLAMFRYEKETSPKWVSIPFELDPLDGEGSLLFPEGEAWKREALNSYDRISFSHSDVGSTYDGKTPFPCEAKAVVELKSPEGYAYLMACTSNLSGKANFDSPVDFDAEARRVSTSYYRYNYSEKNHLVFDKIELSDFKKHIFQEVAKNSDLLIASDIKNFFTLYFDTSDIDAQIQKKRFGPMGLMGGLQFYLKIMLFRLELALMPEVNFFEDSLFMPMSMTLPVNAPRYLRRGSGIYYTWEPGKDVEWLLEESRIDELDLDHLDPYGKVPLAKGQEKFCQKNMCRYSLVGRLNKRLFSLNFAINRKAADWGFFPRLFRESAPVETKLKKSLSKYQASGRMGVYFETARLPKGTHTWDFWIHFPDKTDTSCIRPLQTNLIK